MYASYGTDSRMDGGDMSDNPKYLKRRVKSGHVTADFKACDLILSYEVEATVVGDTGKAMQKERKTHQMPLKVKIDAHTDVRAYARQLVQSSDLIPNNKVEHVETLLSQLKEHVLDQRRRSDSVHKLKREASRRKKDELSRQAREEKRRQEEERAKEEAANACMEDLEEYVEKLYDEDTATRVNGTNMILHLAQEAGNLEDLLENESMMGALSRTLKEDYKRSIELSMNIMNVFLSFATFSQFHHSLHSFQVGNNTMQVIKWELERFAAREKEMKVLAEIADAQHRGEDYDPRKGKKKGEPVDLRVEQSKTRKLRRKQDKLLFVAFHVLLNLAEDEKVEKKMAKRGLVEDLVRVVGERETTSSELLILAMTFLKKLSVTRENKDEMAALGIVEHLSKFLSCSNDTLKKTVLSTLFNLSFDPRICEQMVQQSMIPKLVDMLQEKQFRGISIRLLYHLSKDDKCKSMFTYTDVIPYVMRMVIDFPANHIPKELAALIINLSLHPRICAVMLQGGSFGQLVERAVKRQDPLLFKVVRNVSRYTLSVQEDIPDTPVSENKEQNQDEVNGAEEKQATKGSRKSDAAIEDSLRIAQEELRREKKKNLEKAYKYRKLWSPFVQDVTKLAKMSENPSIMVEAIGVLSNFTLADLPKGTSFADLIMEHDLVEFIHKHLLPGFSEDDVLLEIVILIGQFCLDQSAARLLANSPLVKLIYDLLHEKAGDSEMVLQILFTFHRLLRHKDTGYTILYETQMPRDVCDLLDHKNKVVKVMAETVLDQIVDHDEANENAMHMNRKLARKAVRSETGKGREGKSKGGRGESDVEDEDEDDDGVVLNESSGFCELRGSLSKMIRAKRFEVLNKEWVEMVAQEDLDDLEDEDQELESGSPSAYEGFRMRGEHGVVDDDLLDEESDLDDESTEY